MQTAVIKSPWCRTGLDAASTTLEADTKIWELIGRAAAHLPIEKESGQGGQELYQLEVV